MSKVRVAGFGVSLDGFSAGIEQSLSDPLGKCGPEIFQWFFHTKTFSAMHGQEARSIDVDDEFAHARWRTLAPSSLVAIMFGPVRGAWPDGLWKGWWGDNRPYHAETFVLMHYEREPLVMEGGTSTLSLAESKRRSGARNRQWETRMSRSEAVFPRCGNICKPG